MIIEEVKLGSSRLIHGDALEVLAGLEPGSVGGVLTDPPYSSGGGLKGDRSAATSSKYQSSKNRGRYPEFEGDGRDQRSYFAWSTHWMSLARKLTQEGSLLVVFSDWRQLPVTTDAVQAAGWIWRGIVPWDKTENCRPQLGRYRTQAEYAVWATNGRRPLNGPTAPGVFRHRVPSRKLHIAGKPIELMSGLLQIIDGPVLDPFMGSGTVGVACRRKGIDYVGIEIVREYFETSVERISS